MTGINQHNIPQTVLRGFRIRGGSKGRSRSWLFRKGEIPELVAVKDIAAEPHFYSSPSVDGSKTLDDEITAYENAFARHLRSIKCMPGGASVDASVAAEIVAHLTIRNAHLRGTFSGGIQTLFSRTFDLFSHESTLKPLLGVDQHTPSEPIKEYVDRELAENPALENFGIPREVLHRIAQMIAQERFNKSFLENVPFMMTALSAFTLQVPEFIREGHNKALASGFAPDGRTRSLGKLIWSVRNATDGDFILPDCVALAEDDDIGLKPLIMASVDKILTVLMPITSSKMLVGIRDSFAQVSLATFNKAAASCSHTFFIAARTGADLESFASLIGTSSDQVLRDSIDAAFEPLQRRARSSAKSNVEGATAHTRVSEGHSVNQDDAPVTEPNYSISFRVSADPDIAERIAAVVYDVSRALSRIFALDRVDGITIADDYPAALRDLERGFDALPLEPTDEGYGGSVAMAPTVVRNGIAKTHIVMRGDIGLSLVSEDENTWRLGLHTLVQQFAHAACVQIFDETLPGVLLRPPEDPFEAFLYPYVDRAWRGYFASRASATFNPGIGTGYADLLVAALRRAQRDIPAARSRYAVGRDLDRLLRVVLPLVEGILALSGTLLGHFDGLSESALDEVELGIILDEAGLRDWFKLFDGELSELWGRRGQWVSAQEFLALGRHVERLLWQFGLVPWKTNDNQVWVQVALAA